MLSTLRFAKTTLIAHGGWEAIGILVTDHRMSDEHAKHFRALLLGTLVEMEMRGRILNDLV